MKFNELKLGRRYRVVFQPEKKNDQNKWNNDITLISIKNVNEPKNRYEFTSIDNKMEYVAFPAKNSEDEEIIFVACNLLPKKMVEIEMVETITEIK